MFSILVLFSLYTFDMHLFKVKNDSSFYNFKLCYTILQHHTGLPISFLEYDATVIVLIGLPLIL
jgi:hypothetical protein